MGIEDRLGTNLEIYSFMFRKNIDSEVSAVLENHPFGADERHALYYVDQCLHTTHINWTLEELYAHLANPPEEVKEMIQKRYERANGSRINGNVHAEYRLITSPDFRDRVFALYREHISPLNTELSEYETGLMELTRNFLESGMAEKLSIFLIGYNYYLGRSQQEKNNMLLRINQNYAQMIAVIEYFADKWKDRIDKNIYDAADITEMLSIVIPEFKIKNRTKEMLENVQERAGKLVPYLWAMGYVCRL